MADASFQQEFLESHNTYRAQHNTPPLTLNSELNAAAQRWADRLLALGVIRHSGSSDGENIYYKWSSVPIKLTGKEAVDSWYDEVKHYNWSYPGFSGNTGHFTQVVWKTSTDLGVGMATDGNKVIVVGQYRPAGNISISQYFRENVLPRAQKICIIQMAENPVEHPVKQKSNQGIPVHRFRKPGTSCTTVAVHKVSSIRIKT